MKTIVVLVVNMQLDKVKLNNDISSVSYSDKPK